MSQEISGSRLQYFPITLMPTVMGLVGLAIALLKLQHVFAISVPMGQSLLYFVSAYFLLLILAYAAKIVRYPQQALADWRHPIRINFFPAISICFLLLSIAYNDIGQKSLARVLWLIGTPLHLGLLLHVLYCWFHHPHLLKTFNPAWFIPVVGPILVPVAGVEFAHPEISWFFFATGLVYWILLLAVFLNRVFFHEPMAQKLLPTLFILIAPPAVGFIAYIKLTHSLDPFARILFYFGVFTVLMLLTMLGQFRKVPFFVSWWAYTFPLDAFTLSNYLMFKVSGLVFFKWFALVMTIITTMVILYVMGATIKVAAQGKICIPED